MARQLTAFLDEMHFDPINQWVHAREYGETPIYDTELTAREASARLTGLKEAGAKQKNALLFFMYGQGLSGAELTDLFSNHPQLFTQMKAMHLITAEPLSPLVENPGPDQLRYRLNDLSLASQRLPNGETLYLFVDLPARLQSHPTGETGAQLSGTSYQLLHQLMRDYIHGKDYSGVAADFGAGTGIQALALLKMYPQIKTAISLEIDGRSMNLNRFNALLNGVADRVEVVDNADPKNFTMALGGRQLDLAVSNPPFNTVPHEYEGKITDFGYGGDYGIDITQLFLKQAVPVMKKNAEFIFYSFLAEDGKNHYYISKFLQDSFRGLSVYFYNLNPGEFRYVDRGPYAQALAKFMHQHGGENSDTAAMAKDIEEKLRERGVGRVSEKIVRIVPRGDNEAVTFTSPAALRIPSAKKDVTRIKDKRLIHLPHFGNISGGESSTRISKYKAPWDSDKFRGGIQEIMRQVDMPDHLGETEIRAHLSPPRGGVFIQSQQITGVKKLLTTLLDSKALEKCQKDPICAKLLKEFPPKKTPQNKP